MSKNPQSDLRNSFRPTLRSKGISSLKKANPSYNYKLVRFDSILDPENERVDRYMDAGWEIVSSTENLADDRSTAPKSKEEDSLRPKPLTKMGKGGAEFVYMRISKDKHLENQNARVSRDEAKLSSKMSMKKTGNSIHLTDSEINERNLKHSEE